MNLIYKNFNGDIKRKLKEMYIDAFPRSERIPFWILKYCAKENNVSFKVILDNDKLIGMEYLIDCSDFTYLMYLAVDKNQRGNGYGAKILKDLIKTNKNIVLSIEIPTNDLNDEKNRRKAFYLKNGFYETGKFIEDSGVQYEILSTNKECIITEENLKQRYTKITKSPVIKWIISKLFNMYNINFIN